MEYSETFRSRMVQKMSGPRGLSATALSKEVGVPQPTLSKWVRQASRVGSMGNTTKKPLQARRPQDRPAQEKLKLVLEADALSQEELGTFLRRRGVHESQLEQWREQMLSGLTAPRKPKVSPETRRIRKLEKELHRKEKALAEAAALLILKKKAQEIWGGEGDDTTPSSGR